jgi:hypothetical protein
MLSVSKVGAHRRRAGVAAITAVAALPLLATCGRANRQAPAEASSAAAQPVTGSPAVTMTSPAAEPAPTATAAAASPTTTPAAAALAAVAERRASAPQSKAQHATAPKKTEAAAAPPATAAPAAAAAEKPAPSTPPLAAPAPSAAAAKPEAPPSQPAPSAVTAPGCPPVAPAVVSEGRRIFASTGNCYTCHGPDAGGTALAPSLHAHRWLNITGSYESIVGLVTSGVPQPKQHPAPMPPKGGAALSGHQVCAVAAYVYSLSH